MIEYLTLLVIHFIGDFICQTHWQASNKSKNNIALSKHVLSYTLVLYTGSFIIFDWYIATIFTLINGLLHFATDYVTSRITAFLWAK